jgi:hypothetical protein
MGGDYFFLAFFFVVFFFVVAFFVTFFFFATGIANLQLGG